MSIVLLANGFFRSGTTLTWQILKKSNNNSKVFFEPLNKNIFIYIQTKRDLPLHGINVWEEYENLHNEIITKLRLLHPCLDKPFPDNPKLLIDYLNVFNDLEGKIIIKSTRLHFHMDFIINKYKPFIIHIIRNPYYVFKSINERIMIQSVEKYLPLLSNLIKKLLKVNPWRNPFDLKDMAFWIYKRYGKPLSLGGRLYLEYMFFNFKFFDCFVLSWIISNYEAIKSLLNYEDKSFILFYDSFIEEPENVSANLNQKLQDSKYNIRFDINSVKIRKHRRTSKNSSYKSFKKNFFKSVKQLGIEEEFRFIESVIKSKYNRDVL